MWAARRWLALAALATLVAAATAAYVSRDDLIREQLASAGDHTFRHLRHDELHARLLELHAACPNVSVVASAGQSVRGRDLWVFRITAGLADALAAAGDEADPLHVVVDARRPTARYVANMHGDEIVGRSLLVNLAEMLCLGHPVLPGMAQLVQSLDVYIIPSMNPDGFERTLVDGIATRENMHFVDLNRNFPDHMVTPDATLSSREPETQALMRLLQHRRFHIAANMHGGALVVTYPWDGKPLNGMPDAPADAAVFRALATAYSKNHASMTAPYGQCGDAPFEDGITQGFRWYPIYGGLQDYSYVFFDTYELTIEVGCIKDPAPSMLQGFWEENRSALLAHLSLAQYVVTGTISPPTDADNAPWTASVPELGIERRAGEDGSFWVLLPPRSDPYTVTVSSGQDGTVLHTTSYYASPSSAPAPLSIAVEPGSAAPDAMTIYVVVAVAASVLIALTVGLIVLVRRRRAGQHKDSMPEVELAAKVPAAPAVPAAPTEKPPAAGKDLRARRDRQRLVIDTEQRHILAPDSPSSSTPSTPASMSTPRGTFAHLQPFLLTPTATPPH